MSLNFIFSSHCLIKVSVNQILSVTGFRGRTLTLAVVSSGTRCTLRVLTESGHITVGPGGTGFPVIPCTVGTVIALRAGGLGGGCISCYGQGWYTVESCKLMYCIIYIQWSYCLMYIHRSHCKKNIHRSHCKKNIHRSYCIMYIIV